MRTTNFIPPYKKALMFSTKTFQLDSNGAVRFEPNKQIRSVAVFNNKIEYDVHFTTNNLGFIDKKDYLYEKNPNKNYYAIIGDSFTAGFHGGDPWVPKLRNSINQKDIEIYNFGMCGAGIDHFYRLLKSAQQQLYFSHIIIIAISGDIERRFWYPQTNTSEIRFCPEDLTNYECNEIPCTAKIIDEKFTDKELLSVANNIYKEKKAYTINQGIKGIFKRSELLVYLRRALKNIIVRVEKSSNKYPFSFEALRNIRSEFPTAEISFIHLPTKSEFIHGKYYLDNFGEEIENIGISYYPTLDKINWQENMFHINDGHPNNLGYETIKNVISNYIIQKNN